MKIRNLRILVFLLIPLFAGCNLFSPFSSEGDDADSLVDKGISALQNGNNEEALEYFEKALEKDSENYDALYYHSVATVRANGLDFNTFIATFQDAATTTAAPALQKGLSQTFSVESDTLFNLTVDELKNIVQTFLVVSKNLNKVVKAIEDGDLTPDEFPYIEDVMLSHGLASIVANMVLLLDKDGLGPDFELDEDFLIQRVGEAFQLVYVGDPNALDDIKEAVAERIARNWDGIEAGIRSLYLYYSWSQCGHWPVESDIPKLPNELTAANICKPGSENSVAWSIFEITYNGTSSLYQILAEAGLIQ